MNVLECVFSNHLQHVSLDVNEVGDHPVVHDGVTSKDEGMVVDLCDRRRSGSSDVAKGGCGRSVGTNTMEVVVVGGRFSVLVHGWSDSLDFVEVWSRLCVPNDTKTVNVVEAVPHIDLILRSIAIGSVRYQFWQVVVIDLLRKRMRLDLISKLISQS